MRHWSWLVTPQGLSFPESEEGGLGCLPAVTVRGIGKLSLALYTTLKKEKWRGDPTLDVFSSNVSSAYFIMTLRK